MNVCVFVGRTISADEACSELDAVYLPPVSQGDVYRVALKQPRAIGIIDGYFERVPAVWHKEILWAMTQGINVFGSASMGALRGAELAHFGMEGVGRVFEVYRDGMLEDDDEVAVVHGPAETGYRPLSEAMINIRFTLDRAEVDSVISAATRAALERIAKELFYAGRSYPAILQRARDAGLPEVELDALRDWLPSGQINQKREDAVAMLRLIRQRLENGLGPKRVQFSLENTKYWETAKHHAGVLRLDAGGHAETLPLDLLLEELRLRGQQYASASRGALLRQLALEDAPRRGAAMTVETVRGTTDSFRRERGLFEPEAVGRWMAENDLTIHQFRRIMEEEALLHQVGMRLGPATVARLPDHLRVTGAYLGLMQRARDKQRTLELHGLQNPSLADVGLSEEELVRWYFEEGMQRPLPPDLADYARTMGFADESAFRRAVLREWCYIQVKVRD